MTGKKKGSKEKEERTCNAQRYDFKLCGRPLYDDEHCIFHSKDVEGKKRALMISFGRNLKGRRSMKKSMIL
jgi:hypothetical protein